MRAAHPDERMGRTHISAQQPRVDLHRMAEILEEVMLGMIAFHSLFPAIMHIPDGHVDRRTIVFDRDDQAHDEAALAIELLVEFLQFSQVEAP